MRTMDGNGGKQMMEVTRLKPTFLSDPYRSDSGMLKLLAGTEDVRVMKVQPTSVVLIHSVPSFAALMIRHLHLLKTFCLSWWQKLCLFFGMQCSSRLTHKKTNSMCTCSVIAIYGVVGLFVSGGSRDGKCCISGGVRYI